MTARATFFTLLFLVGTGVFALEGCQKVGYFLDVPSTPYHKVLAQYTRDASYYALAETKYLSHVTFKSADWRRAYVDEYAARFELTESEKQELLGKELAAAESYDEFLISLYTGDQKADDLTSSSSVWKVWLETDLGQRVSPQSISKLSDRDPNLRYFFPYITQGWSNVFVLTFPHQAGVAHRQLRAAGIVASLDFTWQQSE